MALLPLFLNLLSGRLSENMFNRAGHLVYYNKKSYTYSILSNDSIAMVNTVGGLALTMKQNAVNSVEVNKDVNLLKEKFRKLKEGCIDAILMFGSRARGETRTRSDIDLLVLYDGCEIEDPIERRGYLYRIVMKAIGKDFEAVTVIDMEFNHFFKPTEIPSLLLNIYWDGILIYDKTGVLETFLMDVKEKIKRSGLERISDGKAYYWILPQPLKEVKIL